jgi:hypothetical protein
VKIKLNIRDKMIEIGLWDKNDPRDPSKEIEPAWEVVEKWKDWCQLERCMCHKPKLWMCRFNPDNGFAEAKTVTEAICKAALKAKGVEI